MSNLVRVGNVVNFADIENNLRAQPLSDQLLTSGYLSLDGADLSVENLQVSSGIINNSPYDLDTYGTYSLEFDPSFTGSIELTYDIVSSSGERVSVSRVLNVVDNVDDSVEFPNAWGWGRQASEGILATSQTNLSTYIREFTLSDGANADKWDPKVVQQGNTTTIFSQMLTDGLSNPNDPTIADVYGGSTTPVLITNLTAANGTFSSSTVRNRGSVQYTPDPGFAGVDTITYEFTTFDGFVYSVTKSIEVAPTNYSAITIEDPETPPLTPAIEEGVEGEDYIYGGVQINDTNNNWGRRGFNEAGDYWVKVKNQTDDPLIGNGQEIALVMGSADTIFGTNIQTEDILTGLQEGTLITTKSWTSYDGIFNIASFDGDEVQSLIDSGDTLRITRVDATTGEQIGNTQLFDETLMYGSFDQNYNNSLSAGNDFNYADILAANVDPII